MKIVALMILCVVCSTAQAQTPTPDPIGGGGVVPAAFDCAAARLNIAEIKAMIEAKKEANELLWDKFELANLRVSLAFQARQAAMATGNYSLIAETTAAYNSAVEAAAVAAQAWKAGRNALAILYQILAIFENRYIAEGC